LRAVGLRRGSQWLVRPLPGPRQRGACADGLSALRLANPDSQGQARPGQRQSLSQLIRPTQARYPPMKRTFLAVCAGLLFPNLVLAQANWPAFRGGAAAGTADTKGLPTAWSTTQNVVWKADVPGRGWSSPIVWGDRVFLTSFVSESDAPVPKMGHY